MSIPIRSPIVSESDSPIRLDMGKSTAQRWSEITIRVFDNSNVSLADASGVTGTVTGQVVKSGTDLPENFDEIITLSTDPWSWRPELSTARAFIFTVAGLNEGYSLQFTVNNWSAV